MIKDSFKFRWLSRRLPQPTKRRLVLVTGARQTGKTTLVKRIYPDLSYINLDAPENRERVRNIETSRWAQTVKAAVIDEAQKEATVFEKVKYAYDSGELSFSCLLGSSQILLLKKVQESLAGRVFVYELWPLMLSEFLKEDLWSTKKPLFDQLLEAKEINQLLKKYPQTLLAESFLNLKEAEDHLLTWGGMPELLYLDDQEKRQWLLSYTKTYLEKDLSDLVRLQDLDPFKKFQKLSALRSGGILSYAELARDASVSRDTARRYLEYLRVSYQAFFLPPYSKNLTSQVKKSPKLYWVDMGLLRQLMGTWGEVSGALFETMVVSEMYKWIRTLQKEAELFYYRTRSGLEVDILLETPRGVLGFEVKLRDQVFPKDFKAIKEVAKSLGERWLGGICVYRGDSIEYCGEPSLWCVPSKMLFGYSDNFDGV